MSDILAPHPDVLRRARQLMVDYAYAIDEGDLKRWPTFFTDPCLYRITTRENVSNGMPLAIMLCDNHAMLYDRVEAIEQANIYEPHYYRHILSDSQVIDHVGGVLNIKTSFICVRTMLDGAMLLFAAGCYVDEIEVAEQVCLFRSRTVILDASRVDTLIALPF